jgi:hypothetical protein
MSICRITSALFPLSSQQNVNRLGLSWNNILFGRNNESKYIRSKIAVGMTLCVLCPIQAQLLDRILTTQELDNKEISLNNAASDIHNEWAGKTGLRNNCSACRNP